MVSSDNSRPKRPLSAYNLFYRFKRSKILEAHENGDDSKETINRLITAVPGLEEYPHAADQLPLENLMELRRNQIHSVLKEHLSPRDTSKRSHRKSHGAMSFLEMNKIMCSAWKAIDEFARSIFEELAEEGRGEYHKRVAEYHEKNPQIKNKLGDESSESKEGEDVKADVVVSDSKKDADRPKRPLSSYNLFFRFKRNKVLEAHEKGDYSKETAHRLITAVPGLEDYPSIGNGMPIEFVNELRGNQIRLALQENLSPKDTSKRTHRKSHNGAMSFLEMNQLMCKSWKSVDDYSRDVFEELSQEGRSEYQKRVAEYNGEDPSVSAQPKKKIKNNNEVSYLSGESQPEVPTGMPTGLVPYPPPKDIFTVPFSIMQGGNAPSKDIFTAPSAISAMGMMNQFGYGYGANMGGPQLLGGPQFISPVSPTSTTSTISSSSAPPFGYMDICPEPLPISPDIFEHQVSMEEEDTKPSLEYVSDTYNSCASSVATHQTGEFSMNDFPRPPLWPCEGGEANEYGHEASVDDFLTLIDKLNN